MTKGNYDTFHANISSIEINYKKTEYYRLPSPYATNCHYYDKEGIHSQGMCVNSCNLDLYTKHYGYVGYGIPVSNQTRFQKLHINTSLSGLSKGRKIKDYCLLKCQHLACFEEDFETKVKPSYRSGHGTSRVSYIFHLHKSYTAVRYSVKTTLITLLVNVGSSLAWWTGLSVLSTIILVRKLTKFLSRVKRKCLSSRQPRPTLSYVRPFIVQEASVPQLLAHT